MSKKYLKIFSVSFLIGIFCYLNIFSQNSTKVFSNEDKKETKKGDYLTVNQFFRDKEGRGIFTYLSPDGKYYTSKKFDDAPFSLKGAQFKEDKPEFQGYIVQFKEKPLIEKKLEFQEKLEAKKLTSIQMETQFNLYKNNLESKFQSRKNKLKKIVPNLETKARKEFKHLFHGISLDISEKEAQEIKKLSFVKEIYPNYKVKALLQDSIPLIGAPSTWALGYTGTGTAIAVIDTGIDYTHPDLGNCTTEQFLTGNCQKVIGGYDFVNNDSDPMDDQGHGTHCAGIAAAKGDHNNNNIYEPQLGEIWGVAPDAKLLAYKVLDAGGWGSWGDVIAGVERAVLDGANVLSLSLGGWGHPDDPVSQAVDRAVEAGAIVVIAAGNSGPGYRTISSPGCARKAITVGATYKKIYPGFWWDCNPGDWTPCGECGEDGKVWCDYWGDATTTVDQITSFSSRGPTLWDDMPVWIKPDLVAPGAIICAARYDEIFPLSQHPYYYPCIDNQHVQLAGTSMAAPHVAGAAALIKQAYPTWTPPEIKMALRNTALDLGYDMNIQGYGRIDILRAIQTGRQPVALLDNPRKISGEFFEIKGTAIGESYSLYFTQGENLNPLTWNLICSNNISIENNVLCQWDIRELEDGIYTLKLVTKTGTLESIEYAFIKIANAEIAYPKDLRESPWEEFEVFPTWKEIEIRGIATGYGFRNYIIQWCNQDFSQCSNQGITLTNGGNSPIIEDILGKWDPSFLTNADYFYLRLTVYYSNRPDRIQDVKIHVDPTIHRGWPRRIELVEGGGGVVFFFFGTTHLS